MKLKKKGEMNGIVGTFSALGAIAIAIVIGVMITAVVTNVVSGMNQSATVVAGKTLDEEKVYGYGLTSFSTLASKIPTLVTVAAAVLILGLVIGVGVYFMKR